LRGEGIEDADEVAGAKALVEPVGPEVIAITVNGAGVVPYRRLPPERIKELKWQYASWYFAKTTLRAGENEVHVKTRLSPSGLYNQPYKRSLDYCISTGGRWKGPIGKESVEIVFPGRSPSSFVTRIKPDTGKIYDESIQWTFLDFEPQSDEYDIELEFFHPAVAAILSKLKAAYEHEPGSSSAALRYAVHLFSLGWAKGNSGFPPQDLTEEEFQSVLRNISDERDRRSFTQFYIKQNNGSYKAATNEWTPARGRMVQILADADFSEHYPEYSQVEEARKIVEDLLKREPKNADVWMVYLTHFWRFSFAARGHWFGQTVFSKPLRKAIDSAFHYCPQDQRIRAWHEAMTRNTQAPGLNDNNPGAISEAWKNEFKMDEPN
jgi:hypothetical protein